MKRVVLLTLAYAFMSLYGCGQDLHWCVSSPQRLDCRWCDPHPSGMSCLDCTDGMGHLALQNFAGKQIPISESCH